MYGLRQPKAPVHETKTVKLAYGRRKRPWHWLAGLLAALAVAAFAVRLADRIAHRLRARPAAAVRTATVRAGTLEETLRLTGFTAGARGVMMRAPHLRGRRSRGGSGDFRLLLKRLADPGSLVRKGDVVAAFDAMYMLNRLHDVKADRLAAEARLRKLRADMEVKRAAHAQKIQTAKGAAEKAQLNLKTIPVRSAIQAELFRLAFAEARVKHQALTEQAGYLEQSMAAEIREMELQVEGEAVDERRAQANVDRMTARAPIDGLVVVQQVYRGSEFSEIRAGDEIGAGQAYLQIVDPSSMIVEAAANQADVLRLRQGAPARVHFDGYPDLVLPGRVYAVAAAAKTGRRPSYVSQVQVFIRFERTDARVIPSLTVAADVVVRSEPSAAIVPREAVFVGANDSAFAFVRADAGWEKREMTLGPASNTEVAVRSGLREGEVVRLSPA